MLVDHPDRAVILAAFRRPSIHGNALWLPPKGTKRDLRYRTKRPLKTYADKAPITPWVARNPDSFPFLELCGELRNEVYQYCFDLKGIKNYFHRYYWALRLRKRLHKHPILEPETGTPTILLISKQIMQEALGFLYCESIVFDHGCLIQRNLEKVVCHNLLANISSITITDTGVDFKFEKTERFTWSGFVHLLEDLAKILTKGHKLTDLTIAVTSRHMRQHLLWCWQNAWRCSYRDSMKERMNAFRGIHNVRNVRIEGFREEFTKELKKRMESPPVDFFALNLKTRNRIYDMVLNRSTEVNSVLSQCIDYVVKPASQWKERPPVIKHHTPAILLVNKQSSREALEVLAQEPLRIVINRVNLADQRKANLDGIPNLVTFVSPLTLRNLRHLELDLDDGNCVALLQEFLAAFDATVKPEDVATPCTLAELSDGDGCSELDNNQPGTQSDVAMSDAPFDENLDSDSDTDTDTDTIMSDDEPTYYDPVFPGFTDPALYRKPVNVETFTLNLKTNLHGLIRHDSLGVRKDLLASHLITMRNLKNVTFTGIIPDDYAKYMSDVMMSFADTVYNSPASQVSSAPQQ